MLQTATGIQWNQENSLLEECFKITLSGQIKKAASLNQKKYCDFQNE